MQRLDGEALAGTASSKLPQESQQFVAVMSGLSPHWYRET